MPCNSWLDALTEQPYIISLADDGCFAESLFFCPMRFFIIFFFLLRFPKMFHFHPRNEDGPCGAAKSRRSAACRLACCYMSRSRQLFITAALLLLKFKLRDSKSPSVIVIAIANSVVAISGTSGRISVIRIAPDNKSLDAFFANFR